MSYHIVVDLFDSNKAIKLRKAARCRTNETNNRFSLDTPTGLPLLEDRRVQAAALDPRQVPADLFALNLAIQKPANDSSPKLNPEAATFSPTTEPPPSPTKRSKQIEAVIRPAFSPLRTLDYRFSRLTIDWQDMVSESKGVHPAIQSGSIDAGFGVIRLLREKEDAPEASTLPSTSASMASTVLGDGCTLAVLAIPSVMSIADFLVFVEPGAEYIRQIRILRYGLVDPLQHKLTYIHQRRNAESLHGSYTLSLRR